MDKLKDLSTPNSPSKTHFMVEILPQVDALVSTKDNDWLFAMLPYKSLCVTCISDPHGRVLACVNTQASRQQQTDCQSQENELEVWQMHFTVEEENLICIYHNADRCRTIGKITAELPVMDGDMRVMVQQTLSKLERMTDADYGATKSSVSQTNK